MKRVVFGLLVLLAFSAIVSAIVFEIKPVMTKSLTSGNGVCEFYRNEFSTGESEVISVNGASLSVEYLGDGKWKLNDVETNVNNHDFFVYNQDTKLKGVRFDYDSPGISGGNFGVKEQDYYPWDCQGFSTRSGMVSEIKIKEGWNLVPFGFPLRDCYYALENELCKDDVLASYFYIPQLKKYVEPEESFNYYTESEEFMQAKSSIWIYVKEGAGSKKVIGHYGAYIPYRQEYLTNGNYNLKSGWNFLFVDAFMIYDDSWNENTLTIDDLKGNCQIEKIFYWDFFDQQWKPMVGEIDDDFIGYGFVVKVKNDCSFRSIVENAPPPPGVPN